MNRQIRIYIPTGLPTHLEVIADFIPEGVDITWNNTIYEDGHREGFITLPNGDMFSIDEY